MQLLYVYFLANKIEFSLLLLLFGSRHVSSLEKKLYLSQKSRSDDLIPLVFELKIDEMETRVEELEQVVKSSIWTED